MKRLTLTAAALILAAASAFTAGTVIEANTHALQVSRITGAPYLRILSRPILDEEEIRAMIPPMNDNTLGNEELEADAMKAMHPVSFRQGFRDCMEQF